jgi:hypothetical protein
MVNCDLRDGDTNAEIQEAFSWVDESTRDGRLTAEDVLATIVSASAAGAPLRQYIDMPLDVAAGVVADMSVNGAENGSTKAASADFSDFTQFLQAQYALHT